MRDNNILYFIPKYLNFLDFLNLYFHQISRRESFIEILLGIFCFHINNVLQVK